jgi:hypothetical protein
MQPEVGVWRIGRTPDPINFPDPPKADDLDYPKAGDRFDSPTENLSVCYFATDLKACFGETLSRFRPNPVLADAAQESGFMRSGRSQLIGATNASRYKQNSCRANCSPQSASWMSRR